MNYCTCQAKKILTKFKAFLNLVIVSPDSLSAKFIWYILATPFKEKQFVTKLRYHIDPCCLYCGIATFLTHTSAKGILAPNTRHKMIAQMSSSKDQGGDKNMQSLEFIHLRYPVSLVSFSSLSAVFSLTIDVPSHLWKLYI